MLCSKRKGKCSTYDSQLDTALRYGAVQFDITVCCVVKGKGKGKVLHITASWILRYGKGAVQLDITVCCVLKGNGKGKVLHITDSTILCYGTERYNWILRYVV
jgi:hypothetical protein